MLTQLMSKFEASSNQLLVSYTFVLYKKHLCDVFIGSVQQLSGVIRVINEFLAGPEAISQTAVKSLLTPEFCYGSGCAHEHV